MPKVLQVKRTDRATLSPREIVELPTSEAVKSTDRLLNNELEIVVPANCPPLEIVEELLARLPDTSVFGPAINDGVEKQRFFDAYFSNGQRNTLVHGQTIDWQPQWRFRQKKLSTLFDGKPGAMGLLSGLKDLRKVMLSEREPTLVSREWPSESDCAELGIIESSIVWDFDEKEMFLHHKLFSEREKEFYFKLEELIQRINKIVADAIQQFRVICVHSDGSRDSIVPEAEAIKVLKKVDSRGMSEYSFVFTADISLLPLGAGGCEIDANSDAADRKQEPKKGKGGRTPDTGHPDAQYVEMAAEVLRKGKETNKTAAARLILRKHKAEIKNGENEEATVPRLARKLKKLLEYRSANN